MPAVVLRSDEPLADIRRFVKPNELPSLDLWTREFFLAQTDKLV